MATPCFFDPYLSLESTSLDLSSGESHHAIKSRRLGLGQAVKILNGEGLIGAGHIAELENRIVRVTIDTVSNFPRDRRVSIATAIPKRDRQKGMIDMLTQLGVSKIIPLACEYSVTRYKANMHEKWSRIALEACKQSHNPWVPEIGDEIRVTDLVMAASERIVFADASGQSLSAVASNLDNPIVMIGPEGGFSSAEQSLFHDNGIKSVTLANHILRTETAAVAAAAQCL